MSAIDAFATLEHLYGAGFRLEANPIMRWVLEEHPLTFLLTKIILTILGSLILWLKRGHIASVITTKFLLVAYSLITCYHIFLFLWYHSIIWFTL